MKGHDELYRHPLFDNFRKSKWAELSDEERVKLLQQAKAAFRREQILLSLRIHPC